MAALFDQIRKYAESLPAELKEKGGVWELKRVVAERKVFLSKQKLEYQAKFRIDDSKKTVKFTEMLKESASGLSTGGDMDSSPGFGVKTTFTKSGVGGREETIVEQSSLFGKKYEYSFDFKEIRSKIEELAKSAGYEFKYQLTSIGL